MKLKSGLQTIIRNSKKNMHKEVDVYEKRIFDVG